MGEALVVLVGIVVVFFLVLGTRAIPPGSK